MSKIYTKQGDQGKTSLCNGLRIPKNHLRIEAIGDIDELNAHLGIVRSQKDIPDKVKKILMTIQKDIMEITSYLAYFTGSKPSQKRIKEMERVIDKITKDLPKLDEFLIPGANISSSYLHLARSVCRRAERRIVQLSQDEEAPKFAIVYFNRLSDLLFSLAYWCESHCQRPSRR